MSMFSILGIAGSAVSAAEIADDDGSHFGGDQCGVEPLDGVGWIMK